MHVVQPDIGRVGGLSEARRVARMAKDSDLIVVPHAWKTGISVAVAAHLAMVTPHMPFFEFLPAELCETRSRKEAVTDELVYRDGKLGIPRVTGPRRRAEPGCRGGVLRGGTPRDSRLEPLMGAPFPARHSSASGRLPREA